MATRKGTIISIVAATLAVAVLVAVGLFYFWDRETDNSSRSQSVASSTTRKPAVKTEKASETPEVSPGTAYENSRFGYAVQEPAEWVIIKSANGDGMTASAPDNTAVIKVYAFSSPTFNLSKTADEMAVIEKQIHADAKETSRSEITINGHPALEVTWTFSAVQSDGHLSGELRKRVIYSLKDETGYALEYIAESGSYDTNVGYYDRLVTTFKLQ